ncbi:MAG: hypothetical protein ACI9U2_001945, partial [Bradymonadia bacterium]
KWRETRTDDRTWYDRMNEMQSDRFARAMAGSVMTELG